MISSKDGRRRCAARTYREHCCVAAALMAAWLSFGAAAQEPRQAALYPAAHSRPPSFEYEQCANACQIERDRLLTACTVPDNPNRPRYDKPLDCTDDNIKQYVACLAMCPADTGAVDEP